MPARALRGCSARPPCACAGALEAVRARGCWHRPRACAGTPKAVCECWRKHMQARARVHSCA
eukprot:1415053-Alexandrium_andersonii.AAC.1